MPSRKTAGFPTGSGIIVLGVGLVAFAFALIGNQAWEDYWITFRTSRHLVEGHGLVFQNGEKVHTFTSPLGVLIPAVGLKLTGSDTGALWFLRMLSIAALAGAAGLILRRIQAGFLVAAFTVGLALLDSKTVQFATNGMETGLLIFWVALIWYELWGPGPVRWWPLALGFGGLMWTRPDGMIPALAVLTASGLLLIPQQKPEERRRWLRTILAAAFVGGLVYAPWFIWAWSYYGSPVPQTIVAKSTILKDGFTLSRLLLAPLSALVGPSMLDNLFAPTFFRLEDWPYALVLICKLLARLAAFAWLLPGMPRMARAASLATLIGGVYLLQIPLYSWYYGPWTLLGGIALGGVAQTAMGARRGLSASRIVIALFAICGIGLTAATMQTARVQRTWIEENGRKAIGLWLHGQAKPNDTVFVEPLGYIGYYSGLKMLDFPGLSAPEVTRLIRSGQRSYGQLIETLKPDWLVLRPIEIVSHGLEGKGTLKHYQHVRTWDQLPRLDAVSYLPGRSSVEFDAVFMVFRRIKPERSDLNGLPSTSGQAVVPPGDNPSAKAMVKPAP